MNKPNRAWSICAACALMFFCTSGLVTNAFTIYLPYILSVNNFTNTQVGFINTIRCLTALFALVFIDKFYKKFDVKLGSFISILLVAAGFGFYGLAKSYPVYLVGASFAGLGYGFGSMVPIGMILNRWFKKKLSFATGICACVTGFSTLGIPSLITVLIDKIGLGNTFLCECGLIIVLAVLSFGLMVNDPSEIGLLPFGFGEDEEKKKQLETFKYKPVLFGKIWVLLIPAITMLGGYSSAAYSNISVLMTSQGISTKDAALVILVSGIFITFSKVSYGWLSDRISAYKSNWIYGICTAGGLFMCQLAKGNLMFISIALWIYSLGLGMSTVGTVVWAKDLSSPEKFNRSNQLFQSCFTAGGLLFSFFPGLLADLSGGSYLPAFFVFAVFAAIVLGVMQVIYVRAKRQ